MRPLTFLFSLSVMLVAFAAGTDLAKAQPLANRTNLNAFDSCGQHIAIQAGKHFPVGRVDILVDSSRDAYLLAGPLFRVEHAREEQSITSPGQPASSTSGICSAHLEAAEVQYTLLSSGQLRRSAKMQASFVLRDAMSPKIVWSGSIADSVIDSIRCEDVTHVESPNIPATIAPNPCTEHAGVFSSLLEPLVLAGASAVIVLLLFTVRSQ